MLCPGVECEDLISSLLVPTFTIALPSLVSSKPHSPSNKFCPSLTLFTDTYTHSQLPSRFFLITHGETKTACTCNQSCCQLGSCGSWHHLLCMSQCRANVRYEQDVYLCRLSSVRLHTQHNAILIWPLEATHTFPLFSSSSWSLERLLDMLFIALLWPEVNNI